MTSMTTRALVTGASSGIGKAISLSLAKPGARLFLVSLPSPELRAVAAACESQGAQVHTSECDLTRCDATALAEEAAKAMEGVNVLINSAGVFRPVSLANDRPEDADMNVAVNLSALVRLSTATIPHLLKNERSHLISLSSQAARDSAPGMTTYSASKAGVSAFSRSAFAELRSQGLRVTALMPGLVNTPMTQLESLDPERMISVAAIVDTVQFVLNFHGSGCPTEVLIEPQVSPLRNPGQMLPQK